MCKYTRTRESVLEIGSCPYDADSVKMAPIIKFLVSHCITNITLSFYWIY